MSIRDQAKYIKNRNLWRKTTTYGRYKPRIVEFIDGATQNTYSLDLNKTTRFRDPYRISFGVEGNVSNNFPFGEYEEGLVDFNDESFVILGFAEAFSGTPVIVFDQGVSDAGYVNVVNVINDPGGTYVFVSANFSGSIRYRAIYSPTYPCIVSSSYSASFVAVAGTMYDTGASTFSETFPTNLFAPVSEVRASATKLDANPDFANNVSVVSSIAVNNIDNGYISVNVSAPVGVDEGINYLVVL